MNMEDYLVLGVALTVVLGVVWWFTMQMFRNEMKQARASGQGNITEFQTALSELMPRAELATPNFDDLKADIVDMIEEVLGDAMQSMQLPTAQDHIFGALSNIIQHKMMGSSPVVQAITDHIPGLSNIDASQSDEHGQAQN